jgi:serine/threonine protein kinase
MGQPPELTPTSTYLAPQPTGVQNRLAQYRLIKQLGRGGMGVVYQAVDTELNRQAALKVMHPEHAIDAESRARFKREAQTAAVLKNDHIVTIYQVGEQGQTLFLAMELLAGKSLEEWLQGRPRATVSDTLLVGKQLAKGLSAAHAAGLVHRDIKPANLWLEAPRGRLKILDFGLARHAVGDPLLTQGSAVVGTPAYMAPEQARGDAVDHRCDLFSMGCVLYRMLSGRLPFEGNTLFAVLTAIETATPTPLAELQPEVPSELSQLIARLLSKKPGDRPATAQAVFEELVAIEKRSKQSKSIPSLLAPPAQRLPRRTALWAAGGAALLAAGGLSALAVWSTSSPHNDIEPDESPASASSAGESIASAAEAATNVAEPRTIDLLSLVDLSRDRQSDTWTVSKPGQLLATARKNGHFALVLPWSPPAEYCLHLKLTRMPKIGAGPLRIGLSQGASRFLLVVDAKVDKPFYSGLAVIDDVLLEKRSDTHVGPLLFPHRTADLAITVRKNQVALKANGTQVYQWSGDLGRSTRRIAGRTGSVRPLIISGGPEASFTFDEIRLEPLSDDPGQPLLDGAEKTDRSKGRAR